MKINPNPTGIGDIKICNSIVVVDENHLKHFSLDCIADSCEIRSTENGLEGLGKYNAITLIDSRPERFSSFIEFTSQIADKSDFLIWCVFPKNRANILEWIMELPVLAKAAIRDYVVSDQAMAVALGHPVAGDVDARTLFRGVQIGLELSGQKISVQEDRSAEIKAKKQLVSVLESFDLIKVENEEPKDLMFTAPQEIIHDDLKEKNQYIAELEGRVVTLRKKLDALQRKYDALANSKLGKVMLARWEKNKGK